MTNQNEQNVQNVTETPVQQGKKEQIVHWGVKLPVSVKNRLSETLAQWKTDPMETQAETIAKVLDAAVMTGHDIPEEVQKTTGKTREAVMVLLKRINSIGASAALAVDDLHGQLQKQIDANTELQEKYKEDADKLNEQHKALVDQLKEQLKSARADATKLATDYSQLKDSIGGLKDANMALSGQVDDLKSREEELKSILKAREEELEREKTARKADQDSYDKALADARKETEQKVEADRESLKKELEKLAEADKKAGIAQAVAEKQEELYGKFSQEKQKLQDEKADLKARIAELKAQNEALQQRLDQQAKKPETEGK